MTARRTDSAGTVYDRGEVLRACRFMRTWFADLEGAEDPAMNDLMLSIEALAAATDELRSAADRDMFPGTGLQPTGGVRNLTMCKDEAEALATLAAR